MDLQIVSRPERSVICTKVSLNDAKILATPKTSSPRSIVSFCKVFANGRSG